MKRKLFSMLFVLVMIITVIPFSVFAENTGADSSQSESIGEFISGEQAIRDMIGKNGMNAHPRIIMTEEKFAKLKKHIGDNSVTAVLLEKLEWYGD